MRLPRDITGRELAKRLSQFGYQVTRQAGSHIRLTTQQAGEHHLTVPDHSPIRVGTLNSIVGDVALHFGKSKEEIVRSLFG